MLGAEALFAAAAAPACALTSVRWKPPCCAGVAFFAFFLNSLAFLPLLVLLSVAAAAIEGFAVGDVVAVVEDEVAALAVVVGNGEVSVPVSAEGAGVDDLIWSSVLPSYHSPLSAGSARRGR